MINDSEMINDSQELKICLIESMDELMLKQFLFYNLESVDPHLYKLLFNAIKRKNLSTRVWAALNYMSGNKRLGWGKPYSTDFWSEIYFYDVILRTEKFFKNMPNIGKKSVNEIKEYLDEYGLKLNTDLKDIKYEALKSLNLINLKHDYLFVEKRGFLK